MSDNRRALGSILHNAGILTGGKIITASCSFLYIALTTRTIGLVDYGFLVLIHSLALMGSRLSRLQSWRTLIQFGSEAFHAGHYRSFRSVASFCIRLDALSAAIALVISLGTMELFAVIAHWPWHIQVLATWYALISPLMYTGWCVGIFRLTRKFYIVTLKDSLLAVLQTAGVLAGFLLKLKLDYFLVLWGGIALCDYMASVGIASHLVNRYIHFSLPAAYRNWRWNRPGIWQFTLHTSTSQTLYAISNNIATLIVGALLGPADAATYRIARQIANGIITPARLTAPIIYPELVKLRDDRQWTSLRALVRHLFSLFAILSAIILAASLLGGHYIFAFLTHAIIPHATTLLLLMIVSAIFDIFMIPVEPLLMISGMTQWLVRNRIILVTFYIPILAYVTLHAGVMGACLTTALYAMVAFLVNAIRVPRALTAKAS